MSVVPKLVDARGKPTLRACGECTLCCNLLPIEELNKPRGVWCQHAKKGKGCAIYPDRPSGCRTWRCQWIISDIMGEELRPDRCDVVCDTVIRADEPAAMINEETGERHEFQVMQMWSKPGRWARPWRHPSLQKIITGYAELGYATAVRHGVDTWLIVTGPIAESVGLPGNQMYEGRAKLTDWGGKFGWERDALQRLGRLP